LRDRQNDNDSWSYQKNLKDEFKMIFLHTLKPMRFSSPTSRITPISSIEVFLPPVWAKRRLEEGCIPPILSGMKTERSFEWRACQPFAGLKAGFIDWEGSGRVGCLLSGALACLFPKEGGFQRARQCRYPGRTRGRPARTPVCKRRCRCI
jgi:hypothetical protein